MWTYGGEAAEAALTAAERHVRVRLEADWDGDGRYAHPLSDLSGYVTSVSTDRSLAGSAPEEILLIEGASAAELTATLHGEYDGLLFGAVFSPYNGHSPFYLRDLVGVEIRYALGIDTAAGTVWYPQFVGNIRTVSPDRADHTVEITALDRVEKLRRPIQFAPWAINEYHASRGRVRAQLIDSSWVIDNCLRFSDTASTPYRHKMREEMHVPDGSIDGTVFWLTGTGALHPTIGWHARTHINRYANVESVGAPMYESYGQPHPLVADEADSDPDFPQPRNLISYPTDPLPFSQYWVSNRDLQKAVGTHYFGFTLVAEGTNSALIWSNIEYTVLSLDVGSGCSLKLKIQHGEAWTERGNLDTGDVVSSERVPIPRDQSNIRILAAWTIIDGPEAAVYLRVGDADNGGPVPVNDRWAGNPGYRLLQGLVYVTNAVGMNDLFYAFRNTRFIDLTGGAGSGEPVPARYAAVLDPGLQQYTFLPVRNGQDAWEIITQVAAAEYGSVFWDEQGVFRFWNAEHIERLRNTVAKTLTLDQISGLKITHSLDSVRNIWSVEASKKLGVYGAAYKSSSVDEFYVPGRTARTFRVWSDSVIAADPHKPARYTGSTWNDELYNAYVVQWLTNGTWAEDDGKTSGVDINVHFASTGELEVRIWNGYDEPCRLATNDDKPAYHIGGTLVQEFPPQLTTVTDRESIMKYGGRNYKHSGDWVQDRFSINTISRYLLGRTTRPIPATDDITVAGDPRTRLGDTFEIRDPEGFGESVHVQIYGIRREFTRESGLSDTYTVEMLHPPGIGLWDSPQYGLWDKTLIWS
ncbi:hypothetical protein [Amycolatopsis cihanbeyliensis]|uniref:Tail protein n=1 Tax=Amycolatopsis cihanbeyliensis TaxID=1128664 RepID=A0A542DNK9_AMYCI|nr:hypothetical protein [Amycolatopsis cihanbeyliensis]TQJ04699.1 hypothetical protein FB471_4506 [Amycolatopsis cihanbeyliensis]